MCSVSIVILKVNRDSNFIQLIPQQTSLIWRRDWTDKTKLNSSLEVITWGFLSKSCKIPCGKHLRHVRMLEMVGISHNLLQSPWFLIPLTQTFFVRIPLAVMFVLPQRIPIKAFGGVFAAISDLFSHWLIHEKNDVLIYTRFMGVSGSTNLFGKNCEETDPISNCRQSKALQ
jgi:hypothetical protein